MVAQLQEARHRLEKRRSHKLRNVSLLVTGVGVAFAVPSVRSRASRACSAATHVHVPAVGPNSKTVEENIDVAVPVTAAYAQWTQFEEFPSFMEGVDEVKRLDDSLLHWAATVGGKKAEWEAKVVEQEPNRRIVWESVAGKNTRGIVSFEEAGPSTTRIRLSMTYALDDVAEKAGAAAGIDNRRVRGDLERFRDLVEGRAVASA